MKAYLKILLVLQFIAVQLVVGQSPQVSANKTEARKFVHNTEFGFLLGKQEPINNNNIGYPIVYDAKIAQSYYYPYPYYTDDQYSNFTFQHYSGYQFHKAISAGLTAGLDYYRANIITPLSIGVRSTLLPSRRISPIANVDAGYGIIWKNSNDKASKIEKEGGILLNPSAGLRIKLGDDGSNLNINIGYRIQNSKLVNNLPDQDYYQTEYRTFNRLSIRLGIGF